MDRRTFIAAPVAVVMVSTPSARAQEGSRLPRIGFLTPGPNPREPAFWQGMRDLGYVDGKTMVIDRRSAEGDFQRLPALAAEITKNRPTVIVAIASAAALAARQAAPTIPIVVVGSSDPVAAGLAGNLSRPNGNVTGTSTQTAAAAGKLLELVRQFLPKSTRVAALWDPLNSFSQQLRLGETLIGAARLGLLVRIMEVRTTEDLDRAFGMLQSERPDAILVTGDTFFLGNAGHVAELGLAHRLPVFSTSRTLTEAGSFASYGPDAGAIAKRSAIYVHKILRGAKPADLAIEQPTKFEFVINLRTAKAIGVTVFQPLLARADEVIR